MKNATITEPSDVLGLLMNAGVQKELRKVNPKFNRADLLDAILEAWPNGQEGFAKTIYQEFISAPAGSANRQTIMKLITNLISEETANQQVTPVSELSDEALMKVIASVAPVLRIYRGTQANETG